MALYAPFMGGYLPILANYDDIIQIDSFAYNWCLKNHQNMIIFDVEHWCYQTRRRGGMSWYCSFSLLFYSKTTLSQIFSGKIHIDRWGELKIPFIFKKRG